MEGMIDISLLLPRGRRGRETCPPLPRPGAPASFLPSSFDSCGLRCRFATLALVVVPSVIPPSVCTRDLAAVVPVPTLAAGGASAPRVLSHAWRKGKRLHGKTKRTTRRATTAEASAVCNRAAMNRAYAKISARPDEAGGA